MIQTQDDTQTDRVYRYTVKKMIGEKKSPAQIRQALIEKGMDERNADMLISDLTRQLDVDTKKERARKNMRQGGLWCIGGILVTIVTYSAASGGGTYVVAWGAILFGAIQFLRGLISME